MIVAKEYLQRYGIRPSAQRIAVMHYLLTRRTHPTVDEIYHELVDSIPTLSRTTVYNTLHLLYKHGAILALSIDETNVRFDGYTHPHAHFLCCGCGNVYDVDLDDVAFVQRNTPRNAAIITEAQLYYKGLCNVCSAKQQN